MSVQEQAPSSSFDRIKWFLTLVALAGAVYANHFLVDDSLLIRVGVIITLIAIGMGIGFSTTKGKVSLIFAKEARIEARKVVWPTRPETVQTTMIIVVAVFLIALMLYGMDYVLANVVGFLTVRG